MTQWQGLARRLAAELADAGILRTPGWRAAFEQVPRQVFVPRFLIADRSAGWRAVAQGDADYLEHVYRSQALVTQLDGDPGSWDRARELGGYPDGWPTSSSSQPSLMAAMLEALRLDAGMRVLEVGTGTGYNAALLCHRLGNDSVSSVDIDPTLSEAARERLAGLGFHPRLSTADAMQEIPPGPYDRIEVTVAIPRIPAGWLAQARAGALILTTFSSGLICDGLFLLEVDAGGTARGRALVGQAGFMSTRAGRLPPASALFAGLSPAVATRATGVPSAAIDDHESGFPTYLALRLRSAQRHATADQPGDHWLLDADGSWARTAEPGLVTVGGPRDLWQEVERAWQSWVAAGRPTRERLTLTVTPDGHHTFGVAPTSPPLPSP